MRLALLAVLSAAALALLGGASAAEEARAPSYCSTTGDLCYGIQKAGALYNLRLTLAAKYFSRYRICVKRVGRRVTCKSFPVKKRGGQWGGKVNWWKNFPHAPRRYRVTWLRGKNRIGPALNFTLPATAS
jgi:hypothetical protein